MERRLALATIAAFISIPALSQTRPGDSNDAESMKKTLATGSLALATSKLALQKANHPKVKEFAEFEVAEQETVADVLNSLKSGQATGQIRSPSEAEVKQNLTPEGTQELQKLQAVSGAAFDEAYVQGQTKGHRLLLTTQEEYLQDGKNPSALSVAKLARAQIKEHLQLLADIDGELKGHTAERPR
ncbi:MAG: DUF4142 domain-containing protein [Xanthobacteraceae bacterium]|nr:DUF4142 domain-containing protein [Xanthobacteraceae bacterium]